MATCSKMRLIARIKFWGTLCKRSTSLMTNRWCLPTTWPFNCKATKHYCKSTGKDCKDGGAISLEAKIQSGTSYISWLTLTSTAFRITSITVSSIFPPGIFLATQFQQLSLQPTSKVLGLTWFHKASIPSYLWIPLKF